MFSFARRHKTEPAPAAVPRGLRVYAIGDVHGRLDLLDPMLDQVEADAAPADDLVKYILYLGDYVDRGPYSRSVIDRLVQGPPPGFGAIHLKGNHEASMLEFLEDPRIGPSWLAYGGAATLASYHVAPPHDPSSPEELAYARAHLNAVLPPAHRAFLEGLRPTITIGDYLFAHAGIRPGVPLDRQREDDLIWIRDEFLRSTADHGKVVVHGHTICPEPELRANRIGIDTGAYASNRLTCLVLEGTERRFLTT